jgi:aspartate ammonia-lyase
MSKSTRFEHDLLGDREVSNECYYGVQTLRAKENFNFTGMPISSTPSMIIALAYVKKAAALTNLELGLLPEDTAKAIAQGCDEIIGGKLHDQFIVDVFQGGAGTSINMNANEVIANLALEIMGKEKGDYQYCHPNNHVNCSQSTNDAYPTALRIALHFAIYRS